MLGHFLGRADRGNITEGGTMKRVHVFGLLWAFILCPPAPGRPAFAAEPPPIKLGMSASITGYIADLDQGVRDGALLAIERINRDGGVLGRRLTLVIEDMRSEPQQGVTAVNKLLVSDKVHLLVNGFSSAGNAAAAPIVARHKVPQVIASVLPPPEQVESVRWTFTTIAPAGFEVATRFEYLQKHTKLRKVGVLHDPTPYANIQKNVATAQAEKFGLTVVGVEQFKVDDTDVKAQITKLQAAGAEAILKFGAGPTTIVIAKNMREMARALPLLVSIEDLAIQKPASEALGERFFFVASAPQVLDALAVNDPVREANGPFAQAWGAKYGQRDPTYAGRGWDAIRLVAAAIGKVGGTDGEKIRDALESATNFAGTSAVYSYSPTNHYGVQVNPLKLAQIVGGKVRLAYDPAH
jgi:branched-chain amino acid transport system substrate-binding protein